MTLAFVDRAPTPQEMERIRLILSTYQDGTGMLAADNGRTLPGWRDFERSIALALGGRASESKAVFDVVLSRPELAKPQFGLSCKMRRELNRVGRDGRVTLEVSNSSGEFWGHLITRGINQQNYRYSANDVGNALLDLIRLWHDRESVANGGRIDLSRSYYLILLWNAQGEYQLFQYGLDVVTSTRVVSWDFPRRVKKGEETEGRRLIGNDAAGTLVEWYGESGGQLKYYPFGTDAIGLRNHFALNLFQPTQPIVLSRRLPPIILPNGRRPIKRKMSFLFERGDLDASSVACAGSAGYDDLRRCGGR